MCLKNSQDWIRVIKIKISYYRYQDLAIHVFLWKHLGQIVCLNVQQAVLERLWGCVGGQVTGHRSQRVPIPAGVRWVLLFEMTLISFWVESFNVAEK